MILKDFVTKFDWIEIKPRFLALYPDCISSIDNFKRSYFELKTLNPEENLEQMIIHIQLVDNGIDRYHDVSGFQPNHSQTYGLEFEKWEKWLGMGFTIDTIRNYTPIDILIHCLWEMTFFGYDQETIAKERAEIENQSVENREYISIQLNNGLKIKVPADFDEEARKMVVEHFEKMSKKQLQDMKTLIEKEENF